MPKPRDNELVELMETLEEDSSMSWTEKLQRVIDFKRAKRGLIGMHCSTYPTDPAKAASAEETAKCIFLMEKECTSGNMKTYNEPCL